MLVRRTIRTFSILVTSLAALVAAPHALQPIAAARAGALHASSAACGSDKNSKNAERKKARREAYQARREAAATKRQEAAQARREAYQARREAARAKREGAGSAAEDRREAARAKREERHAAALAKREERKAKMEEARQRREEAAEERRERVASAAASRRSRNVDQDDDIDSDSSPATPGGFGTLRVNSRPWAQVYVDGRMVGHTPQLNLNVPAGQHNVRLVNPVFAMSKTVRLNVRNGEKVTRVELLEE